LALGIVLLGLAVEPSVELAAQEEVTVPEAVAYGRIGYSYSLAFVLTLLAQTLGDPRPFLLLGRGVSRFGEPVSGFGCPFIGQHDGRSFDLHAGRCLPKALD
jgi:hypothetical protein